MKHHGNGVMVTLVMIGECTNNIILYYIILYCITRWQTFDICDIVTETTMTIPVNDVLRMKVTQGRTNFGSVKLSSFL